LDDPNANRIATAIYVRNDIDIHQLLQSPDSWIVDVCQTLGVAAPKTTQIGNDKFAMQAQQRKNQILGIIKQYKKQPPQQQARSRKKIEESLEKNRRKAEQIGLRVPDFDDLVNGTSDWETPSANGDNAGAVSSSTGSNKIDPETLRTVIDDAYLRTISRFPSDDERQIAAEFVLESDQTGQNIASFMWTLLNTKEFVLSH
jgi:hypothetical protein